jgi:pimeloyl-ACP methyl ester carboxylesterase
MPAFKANGHRLFYRQNGRGPLLVILPGNTASSAHHEGELAYFGQRYQAVALDFWGTGQSDRPAAGTVNGWEQGARDVAALIAHLEAAPALVMGTSGGGMVALLTAALFPQSIRAVIADSCVEFLPPDLLRAEIANRNFQDPGAIGFWRQGHGENWEEVVAADNTLLLQLADQGGDWAQGRLSQIQCPTLLSGSLQDSSMPDLETQFAAMAHQIPHCRLFMAPEGDHPLMWSRPALFREAADDFLNSLPA